MITHERHEPGPSGEIDALERKIAELRLARAQMHAERDEHVRNAARATNVRDGLASLYHELTLLATERASKADDACRERDEAATELARIATDAIECTEEIRILTERLQQARARGERLDAERSAAELRASSAATVETTSHEKNDETVRAAADLKAKLDAATSEAAIAQTRSLQFIDIAQTLDREQAAAEAAVVTLRARHEASRLHEDLARIRTLETRLADEREALERRLQDLGDDAPTASAFAPASPQSNETRVADAVAHPRLFDASMREVARVSLAARLKRDLGSAS